MKGRHPLLNCPHFKSASDDTVGHVPHSFRKYGNGLPVSETRYYNRSVDMNLGWNDGSVMPLSGHALGGGGVGVGFFRIPDYSFDKY